MAGDCKKKEYKSKFPIGLSPSIEDYDILSGLDGDEPFRVSEGSAILSYLCEKYSFGDWYPIVEKDDGEDVKLKKIREKAKINEYLSNHHTSTRKVSEEVFMNLMKECFFKVPYKEEEKQKGKENVTKNIRRFSDIFLLHERPKSLVGGNVPSFIGGRISPSIADLIAYTELAQLGTGGGGLNFMEFTNEVHGGLFMMWLHSMEGLDFHDDVHKTVKEVASRYKIKP